MAGGGDHNSQTNGGHDQRAMEEGRKEEYAEQGCAAMVVSVPFIQKVRSTEIRHRDLIC
jgi:aquaporin NIP